VTMALQLNARSRGWRRIPESRTRLFGSTTDAGSRAEMQRNFDASKSPTRCSSGTKCVHSSRPVGTVARGIRIAAGTLVRGGGLESVELP
jgi:hypothetical protein